MEIYKRIISLIDMETGEQLFQKVQTPLLLSPEEANPIELFGKIRGEEFYQTAKKFFSISFKGEYNNPTEINLSWKIYRDAKNFKKFKKWKIEETRYIHFTVTYQEEKNFSLKDILEYPNGERAIQFLKERYLTIAGV